MKRMKSNPLLSKMETVARSWFNQCRKNVPLARLILLAACSAGAADSSPASTDSFTDISLEELINIQVTSVSKKETGLFTSPAAIYVITQEDIHRSGMTSLPELLRMVPGMDVVRIDANHWAVSARGFNDQYANKLLVLIDGRTIYAPVTAGIFWNVRNVPLEDIERIEVIRGPGATLWGANAVNGVINIITKSAKDTQGGLVAVTYGTEDQPGTTVQYGGQLATNLFYRAYVSYFNREHFEDSTGKGTADAWDSIRGGFRMDWEPGTENNFTFQGDYYRVNAGETIDDTTLAPPFVNRINFVNHNQGGNVLGRWTHNFSDTSQLSLQTYYDHSEQGDAPIVFKNCTYDFDLQHRFALGSRQDIVWGGGYRYLTEDSSPSFFVTITPGSTREQIFSAFIQDDITVIENRLHLTLGSKLEHNDITGFEVEPSGRLAWTPTKKQTIWAAVSRAVRTPSYLEQGIRQNRSAFPLPPPFSVGLVSVFGNPNLKSEELTAYELGYRIKPAERLSFDVSTFYNVYDRLITPVQGVLDFTTIPPVNPLTFQNNQRGETYGAELLGEWQVTDYWRLIASYSLLQMHVHPNLPGASINNISPQNQLQLRSYLNLPHHLELDGAIYYVDQIAPISGISGMPIPAYVRVDLGMTWRPIKSLEIGIYGQNLADGGHLEFTNYKTTLLTEIPRSVMGRVTWRF